MKFLLSVILAMAVCIQAVHGQNCLYLFDLKGNVDNCTSTFYIDGEKNTYEQAFFKDGNSLTYYINSLLDCEGSVSSSEFNAGTVTFGLTYNVNAGSSFDESFGMGNTIRSTLEFTLQNEKPKYVTARNCKAEYFWESNTLVRICCRYTDDENSYEIRFGKPTCYDSNGNWTERSVTIITSAINQKGILKRDIVYSENITEERTADDDMHSNNITLQSMSTKAFGLFLCPDGLDNIKADTLKKAVTDRFGNVPAFKSEWKSRFLTFYTSNIASELVPAYCGLKLESATIVLPVGNRIFKTTTLYYRFRSGANMNTVARETVAELQKKGYMISSTQSDQDGVVYYRELKSGSKTVDVIMTSKNLEIDYRQ